MKKGVNNQIIKILFLIDEFSMAGGSEKQLILLADSLPRQRYQPVIGVLNNINNNYQKTLGINTPIVNFNCAGLPLLKNVQLIWKLKRYLDRERFDILQTYFTESEIYGALNIRLSKHTPIFIATRRNLYHWVKDNSLAFRALRSSARSADRILVNSHRVFEKCQQMEGISSEKMTVIQNGVEVEKFNYFCAKKAKRSIGLKEDFIVIGVIANLRPVKGLPLFFKAASLVTRKVPQAFFVLVGRGPQEKELKSLVQELGIRDRVLFLPISGDIQKVIAAFDVAVQPSLSESFSNVWLEYMASGKPIVASRVGDAEKIIDHGQNGLLVKPNNLEELTGAILELCLDQEKAMAMGRLAQEKVSVNWSMDKIMKEYQFFYEDLIQKRVNIK